MATLGTYFLDAANLLLASRVYTDSGMSTLAPDGFYGDGTIVRQQDGGLLQAAQSYPNCNPPVLVGFQSSNINGTCFTGTYPNFYYNGPAIPGGSFIPGEPSIGDIIYEDSAGTIPMTVTGDYKIFVGYAGFVISIDPSGVVTNKVAC